MLFPVAVSSFNKRKRVGVRWSLLFLLGLTVGLASATGCSRSKQEPDPHNSADHASHGHSDSTATPSNDPPAVQKESAELEARVSNYFRDYLRHLRQGDLIQAEATFRALNALLGEGERSRTFWEELLPSEFRLTLHLAVLCVTCSDGLCPSCQGKGICSICSGTGLCPACKGVGGEWKPCLQCLCPSCNGTGICPDCRGRGTLQCPVCKGTGEGPLEQRFVPCPSCKGLGYKEGMLRADGTRDRYTCLLCKGAKGTTYSLRTPCSNCGGTGRIPCGKCGGTGRCATCKGVGRILPCPVCKGTGRYLEPCPVCDGQKTCPACKGTQHCPVCHGSGRCPECQGRNAVVRHRFPVDRRWLSEPEAILTLADRQGIRRISERKTLYSETIENRMVSLEAPEGTILWLSSAENLGRVRELFKP